MENKQFTILEISKLLKVDFQGDGSKIIRGVNTLSEANNTEITFLDNVQYRCQLVNTKAAVVILRKEFSDECPVDCIIVDNPYLVYAKICGLFNNAPKLTKGIDDTVIIGKNCKISDSVAIAPRVVIGNNVEIADGVVIHPGCVISDDCKIGSNTELKANVTFYHNVKVGNDCIFHSGSVVGSDGFGNANDNGIWNKIPHLGGVLIGNDVEIGANTTIDRGALRNTIIDDNVRIDNLVQIAHNVHIGAHTALAACSGVAGSATLGKHCLVGGGACINGHITVCDNVMIIGMAMVTNSITEPGIYGSGTGLQPQREWQKSVARFRQLDKLAKRIKELERKLEK